MDLIMKKFVIIFLAIISFSFNSCQGQYKYYVAFWNLENLFDPYDDPHNPGDNEYLPSAKSQWDEEKFDKKLSNLSKIIRSMNNGEGPDILGVCEIENYYVLKELSKRFLSDLNYKIVHYESPDPRGIDVGILYKPTKFELITSEKIPVPVKNNSRDILYAVFKVKNEILHVFVNHWPSRRGGEYKSEPRRIKAATVLRKKIDSLIIDNPVTNILVMGDFNDTPQKNSILVHLVATPFNCDSLSKEYSSNLFNVAFGKYLEGKGSYFYKGKFEMIDQIIVSKGLLDDKDLDLICDSFEIISNELNTTRSGKFKGAPYPTFGSRRYLGGFSDHFPVGATLIYRDNK